MADSTLNRFVSAGTAAARAAYTPTPPTPSSGPTPGYFWHETDTGDTYSWKAGTGWIKVNNSSGSVTTTGSPASGNLAKFSGTSSITNGDLSGDVTTSGTLAATIANDAVTYAKMQNISATSRILGRKTASAGDTEECTLSEILDFVGSAAQGDILYRGAASWSRLAAGTSGHFLKTQGAGADPVWAAASGGSTPAHVLITETVTSGSATNVSFTSISSSYRDLEIRVRGRGTKAAGLVDIRMRFNSDTGSNYDHVDHQLNNTTTAGFTTVGTTSALIGNISAASATAAHAELLIATVGDYRGTTFEKAGHWKGSIRTGTTAATCYNENGSFWWRSTSAITQIDVFPSSNAFVDGTVVSLYGVL